MQSIAISAYELFRLFPEETPARAYLENMRLSHNIACPACGNGEICAPTGKCAEYHGRYAELVS